MQPGSGLSWNLPERPESHERLRIDNSRIDNSRIDNSRIDNSRVDDGRRPTLNAASLGRDDLLGQVPESPTRASMRFRELARNPFEPARQRRRLIVGSIASFAPFSIQ